jgi:hypothetical protein
MPMTSVSPISMNPRPNTASALRRTMRGLIIEAPISTISAITRKNP